MKVHQSRKRVVIFFVVFVASVYWIRLLQLQVFTGKYKEIAKDQAVEMKTVVPPRGLIYDRQKNVLVSNQAVYDLTVVPSKVKDLDTLDLCHILGITKEEFIRIGKEVKGKRGYAAYKPNDFVRNISLETYGLLQEKLFKFKGFSVQPRIIRKYPRPIAAHVLGYLGEVNEKDIEQSDGYYLQRHQKGKTGLELYYEKELRGEKGLLYVMVNKLDIEQGSYNNGAMDIQPVAGNHLVTSLDGDLQEYLEILFRNKKGGLVAIEPKTGEVLALVSSPTYDPELLNGRNRSKNYIELSKDKNQPLFNRALSAMYPPGSTFKIAMALMALEEGVITPRTTYMVNGGYFLPGLKVGDHIFGPVNLHTSIVKSSNAYYCHVFRGIIDLKRYDNVVDGYNNWRQWVLGFGMGRTLGIDHYNESAGILPTTERYDKIYGANRWKSSNILSLSIGQAEISLTPLQLANFVAIVANRGYYIQPHLVKQIIKQDEPELLEYPRYDTDIDTSYYSLVIDAMEDVLTEGTAIRYGPKFKRFQICGKTGTSQNPHGEDHSVFIAFAPKNNPQIAIAAVVENAGQGAHWAAPICFLGIEKYLSDSISSKTKYIEDLMLKGDFIHEAVRKDSSRMVRETISNGE